MQNCELFVYRCWYHPVNFETMTQAWSIQWIDHGWPWSFQVQDYGQCCLLNMNNQLAKDVSLTTFGNYHKFPFCFLNKLFNLHYCHQILYTSCHICIWGIYLIVRVFPFKLGYEATTLGEFSGDVAIDDVKVQPGNCECKSKSHSFFIRNHIKLL